MEDKKLDFNQPLLSVRRYAPTVASQRHDKKETDDIINRQHVIPRHRSSVLKSGPIRNPGAVPFVWEQSPGRPKQDILKANSIFDNAPPPKLPPGRFPKANQQQECSTAVTTTTTSIDNKRQAVDDDVPVAVAVVPPGESPSHVVNVNIISFESCKGTMQDKESCSSGEEEAFVDALDTLSRTESFFLNCTSTSGLGDFDAKKPSSSATDLQFMMDRFLPAAKAMALETPAKQQPTLVVRQQPQQQLKKTGDQYKPSLRYGPSFAKHYSHYHENEKEEEESDDDDDYDERANLCGLLPRFCLKTSLCLLNPTVPAMSMRTRVPLSSANKRQPKSSSAASESISNRTGIKSTDKVQTAKIDGDDKTKLRNEWHSTSTNGIKSHGNGVKTFEELLADKGSPKESNSEVPVIEKTLYVDTVHKVESPNVGSISQIPHDTGVPCSRDDDHEIIISKRMNQTDAVDSSIEHFNKFNTVNKLEKLLPDAQTFGDFSLLTSIDASTKECRMQLPEAFAENQDYKPNSTIKENIQVRENKVTESLERSVTNVKSHKNYSQHPAPPPLPKSPSDSWLGRTLPSVSAKNLSLRSYRSADQCSKAPSNDFKWETIVKTTKVQHRHLHYSEGLLTTIPET